MEQFLSHEGSDCGIANVNIGTSGAEIGERSVVKRNRRRSRIRLRCLEGVHASSDQHDQLLHEPAARARHQVRYLILIPTKRPDVIKHIRPFIYTVRLLLAFEDDLHGFTLLALFGLEHLIFWVSLSMNRKSPDNPSPVRKRDRPSCL